MKIKLLTPVHIGTGYEIPFYEWKADSSNNRWMRINLLNLPCFPSDDVLRDFDKLKAWRENLPWDDALKSKIYEAKVSERICLPIQGTEIFRECIKNQSTLQPIIPGSSLKGAISTGYQYWEEELNGRIDKEELKALVQRLKISDIVFPQSALRIDLAERRMTRKQFLFNVALDFQSDLARGNIPEDLRREFENNHIILSEEISLSTESSDRGHSWLITDEDNYQTYYISRGRNELSIRTYFYQWVECIADGAIGTATISFGSEREYSYEIAPQMCPLRKGDVENLVKRCNHFAREVIKAEKKHYSYYRKRYGVKLPEYYKIERQLSEMECLVRVGWGSNKNAVSFVMLDSRGRRPKSRWLLSDNTPPGWCLLKFEAGDWIE